MEPCPRHLQFFLCWVVRLLVPSWTSLLFAILDASHFGDTVPACKLLTYVAAAEGVAAFLSPRAAGLRPPWTSTGPPLGPSLGWSQRGQGHGVRLRCGAANGLARPGWTRPEKDAGHSPVGHAIPHLPSPASSAHPFQQRWPSVPSIAEEVAGLLQLQRWWTLSVATWAWAGHKSPLSTLWRAAAAPSW